MSKFIDLDLATAFALAASTPALADSKSAAEFALKTCLPAMEDVARGDGAGKQLVYLSAQSSRQS
jgi:hypothetical protein